MLPQLCFFLKCTRWFSCFKVPINETNTQFVEQTIAIMKNLLDNHTEGSSEHLGQASIETMMLNLVRSVLPAPLPVQWPRNCLSVTHTATTWVQSSFSLCTVH